MRKENLREAIKSETVQTELCPCDIRTNQFCMCNVHCIFTYQFSFFNRKRTISQHSPVKVKV